MKVFEKFSWKKNSESALNMRASSLSSAAKIIFNGYAPFSNYFLIVSMLCSFALMIGECSAAPQSTNLPGNVPGVADIPLSAAMTALGLNNITTNLQTLDQLESDGKGQVADIGAEASRLHTALVDMNDLNNQRNEAHRGTIRNVGVLFAESPAAAGAQASLIELNNLAQNVYAAADTLGSAMALAIINKYAGKTKEEQIALVIDEGRRYGYFNDDFTTSENDKDHSFSLISKAFAQAQGKDDMIYAMGCKWAASGYPSDLSGLSNTNDISWQGGKQPIKKNRPRGCEFGDELTEVQNNLEKPACTKQNASAQCNSEIVAYGAAEKKVGEPLTEDMQKLAWNGLGGGGGGSTDNSDDSFFISKAYAVNKGNIDVVGPNNQLGQAQQAWCQQAKQQHVGEGECQLGGGKASAKQIKYAMQTAMALSVDYHAANTAAGARHANDIIGDIQTGSPGVSGPWEP